MMPADSISCPRCNSAVDVESRFCKHCAFDLSKPASESEVTIVTAKSQKPTKPKRTLLLVGVGIFGLLILGILGGYIYKRHRAQATASTNSAPTPSGPIVSDRAKQVEDRILRGETLTESDIAGLSPYELRVLRNIHFARYGRKYDQTGELGSYFYTRAWYKPSDTYNDAMLNATDKTNVNLILAVEKSNTNSNNNSNTVVMNNPQPVSTPAQSNELTRETVMSLVRDRRQPVTVSFARSQHETFGSNNYERLITDRVITCQKVVIKGSSYGSYIDPDRAMYQQCVPGPNGRELTASGSTLDVIIGYKVPSQVTGISKVDEGTSYADVLVVFERTAGSDVFAKYSAIFNPYGTLRINAANESRRVLLRRYDDGWRLERF